MFHTRTNLSKCYAHIPWLQHSSTVNRKCNEIDTCLNAKCKQFLAFAINLLLLNQKCMYSESNKEINNYRYLNFTIQPTCKKYRLVVHSDCHWNIANLRVMGSTFLRRIQGHLYVHYSKNFLNVSFYTQEQRRKLTNKINKKSYLSSLHDNDAKI